ncbi:MAG: polysaccharide deacetylase family protein [Eubacterium sp.]|nr:polysaccharide deacetylase family protein [Eubacterium sp.]
MTKAEQILRRQRMRKRRRQKMIRKLTFFVLFIGIPLAILLGIVIADKPSLSITMNGDEEMTVEAGNAFTDPGVTASYSGTLIHNFDGKAAVSEEGSVDTSNPGTYTITYTAKSHRLTAEKKRTVVVKDTTPPVLTLKSDPDSYTVPGQEYVEEGYTAIDNLDGDITDQVTTRQEGDIVYYSVKDSSGNEATAERSVNYDDRTPPVITLDLTVDRAFQGQEWMDSYTAEDNADGDLTDKVEVEGSVDTSTPGTYTINYKVTDSHGNSATASRSVDVAEVGKDDPSRKESSEKVIYLTFDDGPNEYTGQLLEVLDKYDAKATFFVTEEAPQYEDLIADEAEAGHAIGVHSFSHVMEDIYASADAYWEDFNKMNDIIKKQTGRKSTLMRFPGGSSNTISSFTPGIMTELTGEAAENGYSYFDWNCSAQDATTPAPTADQIVQTLKGNVQAITKQGGRASVILCHDTKKNTLTAMDSFIPWAQEQGYVFLPLSESSFPAHQKVAN